MRNATTTITVPTYSTSSYSVTASVELERGTILIASGKEWLWKDTASITGGESVGASADLLTNIATSFTRTTLWPNVQTSLVEFLTFTGTSSTAISTVTNSADTTALSSNNVSASFTTATITAGNNLPRSTVTTPGYNSGITGGGITAGFASQTFTVRVTNGSFGTTTGSSFSQVVSTIASTVTARIGMNTTTAVIAGTTTATISRTLTVRDTRSVYTTVNSSSSTGESSGSTVTQEVTNTVDVGMTVTANHNSQSPSDQYLQVVPGRGAMKIFSAMKQSNAAGTNIALASSIYYPFVSSVQENVMVPVTFKSRSAVTGGSSISYKWKSSTLFYTTKTANSTTNGKTTGTAQFSIVGSPEDSAYSARGSNVLGGYSPVSSAGNLAVFVPAGRKATSYDTGEDSSTATVIRHGVNSSSVATTVRVERAIPAFRTSTTSSNGGVIFAYERNGSAVVTFPVPQ